MNSEERWPAVSNVEAARDVIYVEGLRVSAFIGVLKSERIRRQDVVFDVEMTTVEGYSEIVRTTGKFVSYADVVEFIEEKAGEENHVGLVEEWAGEVAEFALSNPLVETVMVKVSKPHIIAGAEGVGIRVLRRRPT